MHRGRSRSGPCTREDVQSQDRDEVDRHVDGETLVIAAQAERKQRDSDGCYRNHGVLHTRRTCLRPKRPVGLMSKTISRTANAIGRRNSDVAKPTYCPIRFRKTPSTRPPITAPAGLSSPPSTAAAKA